LRSGLRGRGALAPVAAWLVKFMSLAAIPRLRSGLHRALRVFDTAARRIGAGRRLAR